MRSEVAKKVREIAREIGRDDWETFRLLLELSFCTLAQRSIGCNIPKEELEARYMRAIEPYKDNEARHKFAHFLAEVMMRVNEGGCDALGEAAGELELLNSHLGQFFTPYHVARLNAEMMLNGWEYFVEERGYMTLCEPACGAGCMVLAAADMIEAREQELSEAMLVEATDLSEQCYMMSFVQLAVRGVSGIVRRGNTLTDEVFDYAWLPATRLFYDKHGWPDDTPPPRHRARAPRHRERRAA